MQREYLHVLNAVHNIVKLLVVPVCFLVYISCSLGCIFCSRVNRIILVTNKKVSTDMKSSNILNVHLYELMLSSCS